MQEMRVVALGMDRQAAQPVLLLQETGGEHRVLPVWVGVPEATAIELARRHVEAPRPQTHQLIVEIVRSFGRHLEHVRITMLQDSIFHGELVFDGDTRISARVSDSVAIALHLDVPIHAEDAVLDEAALLDAQVVTTETGEGADTPAEPDEAEEVEQFRRFLDEASPEDFGPSQS
jgi:bifunctional DNase/RNase